MMFKITTENEIYYTRAIAIPKYSKTKTENDELYFYDSRGSHLIPQSKVISIQIE